ncbi:histidine phosphatase family protein, partial [Candidatus Curtissbacteria bacterium]|nr:histidine phosphatase family protein [Candidatus Curtissbacteria bacterium]
TKLGIQQATDLGKRLKNIHFDAVFSSDAARAKRTAEIISLEKELTVETTELLREKSYGAHEGKPINIYETELKQHLEQYEALADEQKWSFKFPSIETDEAAVGRIITHLREISLAYRGKTVLMVTHGTVMRLLLIRLGFGTYSDFQHTASSIGNGAYVKLESDGIDFKILETDNITKSN